ncbi:MAG TPA: monovalent cation:proton antiporter-2 (CPA2) family protein [Thiobacillaceae bacterium]|nr:monovalent cation:proton antiporter-2 (CPA2) family protein [Thiobacillaceae bacterium]
MHSSLQLILVLLAVAVLVTAAARALRLPTMLGYLVTGIAIGPFALGWIPDLEEARHLAEFGVVFLMFSIGLEFSLARLMTMRLTVFGFGGAQVVFTIVLTALGGWLLGLPLLTAVALGGIMSMSSTAIVSKLLAERLEIQTPHGRQIFGALLFQDLAVVPLLILIPAFAKDADNMGWLLGLAALKAAVVLGFLLFFGQRIMRPWFQWVAGRKSPELFTLNLLLFTLGLAFLTESAGLSLALGAFLAGMLVSETEYRYQVEDDIKPFRDVLLGLFFVTIGMRLDPMQVMLNWSEVLLLVAAIIVGKGAVVTGLAMLFGSTRPTAVRTALGLAQASEFGFVLLAQATDLKLLGAEIGQPVLAAMVISMLVAPLMIQRTEQLTRLLAGSEWAGRAKEVHDIAVKTFGKAQHVIICGYGRSGQNLARLLEAEGIGFVALDSDPERIRAVAASGVSVVYGDASRREVLVAAGLARAQAVVVTYSDVHSSMAILRHVRELRPALPVVVRTIDDTHIDALKAAGAAEVVSEVMEGSLMLASNVLMLLGVPLAQVAKRIVAVRESRYAMMRGFFRGASDADELDQQAQPRLHTVLVTEGAAAAGRKLESLALDNLLVEVAAIRRQGIKGVDPQPDTEIRAGDVLVLRGAADGLAAAEFRLLQG